MAKKRLRTPAPWSTSVSPAAKEPVTKEVQVSKHKLSIYFPPSTINLLKDAANLRTATTRQRVTVTDIVIECVEGASSALRVEADKLRRITGNAT